jgi:hypothetical protein
LLESTFAVEKGNNCLNGCIFRLTWIFLPIFHD